MTQDSKSKIVEKVKNHLKDNNDPQFNQIYEIIFGHPPLPNVFYTNELIHRGLTRSTSQNKSNGLDSAQSSVPFNHTPNIFTQNPSNQVTKTPLKNTDQPSIESGMISFNNPIGSKSKLLGIQNNNLGSHSSDSEQTILDAINKHCQVD